jgi:acetyl esterase/lipase
MSNNIIAKEKLSSILDRPEFKEHRKDINFAEDSDGVQFGNMSLQEIAKMVGTWNAESMTEGMRYLSEKSKSGDVFFDLWTEADIIKDISKENTALMAFTVKKKSKFILICAGGGYASVASIVEGFPVAKRINELGYTAFVLKYRTGKHTLAPNPMDDIAQAVRFIRENAERFNIDIEDYAVAGFSAGGHLAASFGLDHTGYRHYDLPKPGTLILAYPVITMTDKTHSDSRKNLLGEKNVHNQKLINKYSIELNITSSFPPSFVWQCNQDNIVPIENTEMLVKSLKKKGVPYAYEVIQSKAHGWGIGKGTEAEGWVDRAIDFWRDSFKSDER